MGRRPPKPAPVWITGDGPMGQSRVSEKVPRGPGAVTCTRSAQFISGRRGCRRGRIGRKLDRKKILRRVCLRRGHWIISPVDCKTRA
jgi:hypothetical protein